MVKRSYFKTYQMRKAKAAKLRPAPVRPDKDLFAPVGCKVFRGLESWYVLNRFGKYMTGDCATRDEAQTWIDENGR